MTFAYNFLDVMLDNPLMVSGSLLRFEFCFRCIFHNDTFQYNLGYKAGLMYYNGDYLRAQNNDYTNATRIQHSGSVRLCVPQQHREWQQ